MSRIAQTTLQLDHCCGQTHSSATGLFARLLALLRPRARLPLLDVATLSDHQLRDMGLADGPLRARIDLPGR
jgi:hypothetical protein